MSLNLNHTNSQRLKELANGNKAFQENYFKKNKKLLENLATEGQNPSTLFIGCSDSRVIPDLIVDTDPGHLFVVRNVGNFVAPYKEDEDYHSTAAAIEYAIGVLEVTDIIICGHSHCGAIAALHQSSCDNSMVLTYKWLSLGNEAKKKAIEFYGNNADQEALLRATEKFSIITQIEHLLTYPKVQEKQKAKGLHIHGLYYDIETGGIEYYDKESNQFRPLSELADGSVTASL